MENKLPTGRLAQANENNLQSKQQGVQAHPRLEFETPEAALRHDLAATEVPAQLESRLKASVAQEPAPSVTWWRRFFGKKS